MTVSRPSLVTYFSNGCITCGCEPITAVAPASSTSRASAVCCASALWEYSPPQCGVKKIACTSARLASVRMFSSTSSRWS